MPGRGPARKSATDAVVAAEGERRLSPIVSAETEALMRRLRSASSGADDAANVAAAANAVAGDPNAPLLASPAPNAHYAYHPQAAHHSSLSAPMIGSYPGTSASYGTSPSFSELGLTKTAQ